jgi:phytoene dehydrogenase-like protein
LTVHRDILFSTDLEKQFSLTGGNIFHGAVSLDQLYAFRPVTSCSNYGTSTDRLYFYGNSTHRGDKKKKSKDNFQIFYIHFQLR